VVELPGERNGAPAERLLAIFAHPDDESIVAGGTLAACAAAGVEVVVVSATRGEQGPIADAGLATRATLGDVREGEFQQACALLGVRTAECWRFPDGELDDAKADLAREITSAIHRWRPGVVISFGRDGLYRHPDHVAVHGATAAALCAVTAAAAPWAYQATWPEDWMAELVAAVTARGLTSDLWGLDPDDFGVARSSITTVVDVRAFLTHKLGALESHRSQLTPRHLFRVIPRDLQEHYLGLEFFVRAQPREAERDWLCGVVATAHAGMRA